MTCRLYPVSATFALNPGRWFRLFRLIFFSCGGSNYLRIVTYAAVPDPGSTSDTTSCIDVLEEALATSGTPDIFNTDQCCQFTSENFTDVLKAHGIQISMDGKGRWMDNVLLSASGYIPAGFGEALHSYRVIRQLSSAVKLG